MKYRCRKLIACHVPTELANAIDDIADSELLSRSQVVRDALIFYAASRAKPETESIRSTRQRMLQGDVWGKLFNQQ